MRKRPTPIICNSLKLPPQKLAPKADNTYTTVQRYPQQTAGDPHRCTTHPNSTTPQQSCQPPILKLFSKYLEFVVFATGRAKRGQNRQKSPDTHGWHAWPLLRYFFFLPGIFCRNSRRDTRIFTCSNNDDGHSSGQILGKSQRHLGAAHMLYVLFKLHEIVSHRKSLFP